MATAFDRSYAAQTLHQPLIKEVCLQSKGSHLGFDLSCCAKRCNAVQLTTRAFNSMPKALRMVPFLSDNKG